MHAHPVSGGSTLTLGQLRTFREVARTGSVQGAAEVLFVTPPTVSAAVAALQERFGVPLLERDGRGIRLTAAGEVLARYASEVLGLVDRMERVVPEAAGEPGHLRLAAVTTAAEHVLPAVLASFRARYDDVTISLEVGNRATVIERLAQREADLGVGGRPPEDSEVRGEPVLANDLVVVAPADDPLAKVRRIPPSALASSTWLLREHGSGTRATTLQFLREHGVDPPTTMTIGSNGAVVQAVAAGLGITLLSGTAVRREMDGGVIARLRVEGTPLERPWHALYRDDELLPEAAHRFLDHLRSNPTS